MACIVDPQTSKCVIGVGSIEIVTFSPPFIYNYQCSYVFAEFYVPAFIYVCLLATFGVPLLEIIMVYLHDRAVPGTHWFTFINTVTPRILKPTIANVTFPRNVLTPYFDATQFS